MKNNSNLSILKLILSVLFLLFGLCFNPVVLPLLFPGKTGKHLDGISMVLVLFIDIFVLGMSFFFFKNRKIPLSRFIRTNWREVLTLGCSVILCFFFAEWILWRWALSYAPAAVKSEILMLSEVEPSQRIYVPRLYLNYSLTPEYRLHVQKDHNSFGYREKEFSLQKSDGVFRIVCLGDSTTYTPFVSDWSKSYLARLEYILRNEYGYPNVEVINAGTPGYSSWETLMNFAFRALDVSPDMIIIYHAVNDFETRQVLPETYRGDNTGLKKSWGVPKIPFWQKSMILRLLNKRYRFFEFPGGKLQSYVNTAVHTGIIILKSD